MGNKRGISLTVLIITVIVIGILASIVAFSAADSVNNSKKAAFATDLSDIEDLIDEYYLNNNELPMVSDISYNKTQAIALITNGADILSEEITLNGDDSATFYQVDLSKLPITNSARGTEADGDATDIYLVSSENFNLYYLKGEKIAGDYYFSLSERLTGKSKVNNDLSSDASDITISTITSGIKLTKSTSAWANDLTVKVKTTLETNETIEYLIAGTAAGTSTTAEFTIDLATILSSNTDVYNAFYADGASKVLTINKYDTSSGSNALIATASMDISNLDTLSGSIIDASNITYTEYDNFILANITGYTDLGGSGVKEARVLYTQKLDSSGNTVLYYEDLPSEITAEYIKNVGSSSNASLIKLPTDVVTYAIVFIDNAGNISNPATYAVSY